MAVWILSRKEHNIPKDINKPEIPGIASQRPYALYNMQNSATARLLFYRLETQTFQPRETAEQKHCIWFNQTAFKAESSKLYLSN